MNTARAWKRSIRENETQNGVRMVNERRQYNDYIDRLRGGQDAPFKDVEPFTVVKWRDDIYLITSIADDKRTAKGVYLKNNEPPDYVRNRQVGVTANVKALAFKVYQGDKTKLDRRRTFETWAFATTNLYSLTPSSRNEIRQHFYGNRKNEKGRIYRLHTESALLSIDGVYANTASVPLENLFAQASDGVIDNGGWPLWIVDPPYHEKYTMEAEEDVFDWTTTGDDADRQEALNRVQPDTKTTLAMDRASRQQPESTIIPSTKPSPKKKKEDDVGKYIDLSTGRTRRTKPGSAAKFAANLFTAKAKSGSAAKFATELFKLAVKEAETVSETMSPCKETKESRRKYASPSRKSPRIDAKECVGRGPIKGNDGTMWIAENTKRKRKDGTFVVKWVRKKNKDTVVATKKKDKRRGSPPRPTRTVVAQVGVPATRFQVSKDEDGGPKMLGVPGKEGVTYLVTMNDGTEAALKTFKPDKSSAKIQKEAELQQDAANAGISPTVFEVQTTTPKYILMEKFNKRLVDYYIDEYGKRGSTLEDRHQDQLIAIMETLDEIDKIGILHNDGNVLNLMLDDDDNLKLIDFGMAREFNKKDKDLGNSNGGITLPMMDLGLKRKGIYSGDKVKKYIEKKIKEKSKR